MPKVMRKQDREKLQQNLSKKMNLGDSSVSALGTGKRPRSRKNSQAEAFEYVQHVIHEYDEALYAYQRQPSRENMSKKEKLKYHLGNPTRLAERTADYMSENNITRVVSTPSRLRELINRALSAGKLFRDNEGLIRNAEYVPINDIPSTGRTYSIIVDAKYISDFYKKINEELIDYPITILNPCNNLVIVVELSPPIDDLETTIEGIIRQICIDMSLDKNISLEKLTDCYKISLPN